MVHKNIWLLGVRGSRKTNIEGGLPKKEGLGQFAALRGEGGLARKRGWCFWGSGLIPQCTQWLWCQECIFYYTPRKKRYTLYSKGTDIYIYIYIQKHNHQKDLNPFLSLYYYGKVIVELEKKTQTRNFTVFMVFVVWPSSTLKILFVFDFS